MDTGAWQAQSGPQPKHGCVPIEGQDRDRGVSLGSAATYSPIGNIPRATKPLIYNLLLGSIWEAKRVISRESKMLHISVSFEFFRFP